MSSILKVDTLQDVNGNAIISSDGSGNLTPNTFTALTVSGDLTVDTNTLYVDSTNNRVGIGTSSPSDTLDVNGNLKAGNTINFGLADSNNTIINVGVGATGNKFAITDYIGDTTYTDYGLRVGRKNDGANGTSTLEHRGTGGLVLNAIDAGNIQLHTSNSERMRIDSSGNVGIGTTSPATKLHVVGTFICGSGGGVEINGQTIGSGDLDNFKVSGFYRADAAVSNVPSAHIYAVVIFGNGTNVVTQIATRLANTITYVRSFNTSWTSWVRLD